MKLIDNPSGTFKIYWQKMSVFLLSLFLSINVFANPVLDNVASGNVSVQQGANSTVVNQTSDKAIINWQSFNIGQQESTHFQQPVGGIALNRISPLQGASEIYGRLTATGQIILMNPAGIYFGPSAYVNVGGLVATTLNMTDENFKNGNYIFSNVNGYSGSVINQGTIIAANHGLVALVANNVRNDGLIQANLGHVVLASGGAFTLNLSGDGMINFAITDKANANGNVTNTGSLIANGGTILVSAQTAQSVLDNVINLEGVVEARTASQRKGEIIIGASPDDGVVRVAANVNASGKGHGEKGGTVKVTGHNILVDSAAKIDVSGDTGGGNIYIGGNYQGKGPLPNANAIYFAPYAQLNADAITNGKGGEIILWSDTATRAYGNISARGGLLGGDGGFIETSGKNYLDVDGITVNASSPKGNRGTWLLDPSDLTIVNTTNTCTSATMTGCTAGPTFATNNTGPASIGVQIITNALANNNVIVQTTAGGAGNGDIIIGDATFGPLTLSWTSRFGLTLNAIGKITLNSGSSISSTQGNITFNAGNDITLNNSTAAVSISSLAGNITLNSTGGNIVTNGTVTTSIGNISLTGGNITNNSAIISSLGNINITSSNVIGLKNELRAPLGTLTIDGVNAAGSIVPSAGAVINVQNFRLIEGFWSQSSGSMPSFTVSGSFQLNPGTQFLRVASGSGSSVSPYGIVDIFGLQGMVTLPGGPYINILNNIDATVTKNWNSGAGFVPIGSNASPYAGNFNGGNFVIKNLFINRPGSDYVGLFGVSSSNQIANIGLQNAYVAGRSFVGGLIGQWQGAVLDNVYTTGTVTGTGGNATGGLIGFSNGPITHAYSAANVTSDGTDIGGLVGQSSGNMTNVYSVGTVTLNRAGNNPGTAGGLVGWQSGGTITNAYASGLVTGDAGIDNLGGLIGAQGPASVVNSFWDTQTTGLSTSSGSTNAAGYKGMTTAQMKTMSNFTNLSFVTGAGWSISGIDGFNSSTPANVEWFLFDFNGLATRPILKAEWSTNINNAHQLQLMNAALSATYNVRGNIDASATSSKYDVWGVNAATLGGFVPIGKDSGAKFTGFFQGLNSATQGYSYAIQNLYINGNGDLGLFGSVSGSINNIGLQNAYVRGTTNVGLITGILAGGTINASYATGILDGNAGGTSVGGLVGVNNSGTISSSYSDVNIISQGNYVGGLVGYMSSGAIANTYSIGSVTFNGIGGNTGGLLGLMEGGSITNSYASGLVTGTSNPGNKFGGLIGNMTGGTVINSFWDLQTTGQTGSSGSTNLINSGYMGMTTNQMKDPLNFLINDTGVQNPQHQFITSTAAAWSIYDSDPSTTNATSFNAGATAPANIWLMFNNSSNDTRPMLKTEWNTTITNMHQLEMMNAALGATYTLAQSLDASATRSKYEVWGGNNGFVPVGSNLTSTGNTCPFCFTGNFDGNNHLIKDIYISGSTMLGLFGRNAGMISNIGVSGEIRGAFAGGIVGQNDGNPNGTNGIIANAYNYATIGYDSASYIGGIAGINSGTISDSFNAGSLKGYSRIGGIVGESSSINHLGQLVTSIIHNAYNVGSIDASHVPDGDSFTASEIGGIIGGGLGRIIVDRTYNSGLITLSLTLKTNGQAKTVDYGGIVGYVGSSGNNLVYLNNFWDSDTSNTQSFSSPYTAFTGCGGDTAVCAPLLSGSTKGITNLTTAQFLNPANFTNWTINNTVQTGGGVIPVDNVDWIMLPGNQSRPMLRMEWQQAINSPHALQLMAMALGTNYTLDSDVEMSGLNNVSDIWATPTKGFISIGNTTNPFTGEFDGNFHKINNLIITPDNNSSPVTFTDNVGLFGVTSSSTIQNVGLTNVLVAGNKNVGGLIGTGRNTNVFRSFSIGTVRGTGDNVGGLIGSLMGPTGFNTDFIVSESYSLGQVISDASASKSSYGGLIGFANAFNPSTGYVTNSYSMANVIGTNITNVGGLIGNTNNTTTISNNFSAGYVTGAAIVGGFLGQTNGNTIVNNFWDAVTSNQASPGNTVATKGCFDCSNGTDGFVNMSTASPFTTAGWDLNNIWGILPGQSYPYLRAFYPLTPRAITGLSPANVANGVPNSAVALAADGVAKDNVRTFGNGFYYFLEQNRYIADRSNILVYLNDSPIKANAVAQALVNGASHSGTNLTKMDLVSNTVVAGIPSTANNMSNTILTLAKGTLTDADILYSYTLLNLTFSPSVAFTVLSPTVYNLDGNITSTGALTFNGLTNITATSPIINSTNAATNFQTVSGAGKTLNLQNANGSVIFNGPVTLGNLTTIANAYAVTFMQGATILSVIPVTFANTGGVTFNGAFNFDRGLISTAGTNVLNGTIDAVSGDISLGTTTITGTSTINSYSNALTLGATNDIASGTNTLSLNADIGVIILNSIGTIRRLNTFNVTTTGSANDLFANSILTTNAINLTSGRDLNVNGLLNSATINLTSSNGTVSSTGSGVVQASTALTTSSKTGTTLNNINNAVNNLTASNSGVGNISITNKTPLLTIAGITQSGFGSSVSITQSGGLTLSGQITTNNGSVNLTTLSPVPGIAGFMTINSPILSNGGAITLDAANNNFGSQDALTINALLNSSPGSGGTLTIGGGIALNVAPIVGPGNISLQGNGNDLTLSNPGNFAQDTIFEVNHSILVTGSLTSSLGKNLTFISDRFSTGDGGVYIQNPDAGTTSIASGGNLTIQHGKVANPSADENQSKGIHIDSGTSISAQGAISLIEWVGNADININVNLSTPNASAITITAPITRNINLGANVTSAGGPILFNSPVNLLANATVDAGAGAIQFSNAVTDAGLGNTLTLQNGTTGAGTVTFAGDVDLAGLTTFNRPYAIIFNGSNNTFTNPMAFLNTGDVTFGNHLSDTFNFGVLNRTAGKTILNSRIYASSINLGNSLPGRVISLAGDALLSTANSNGNIVLNNTIDGNGYLEIDAGLGLTTIENTVGANTKLSRLNIHGALNLNGASVDTTGDQTYGGAVVLGHDVNFKTTTGAIDFGSTLNGGFAADINANTNTITFGSDVGALTTLNKLTTTAGSITLGSAINAANVHTVQEQIYDGQLILGNDTNLTSDNAHLQFAGPITNTTARDLNLFYATYTTFNKDVGSLANPLKTLTLTGSGANSAINFSSTGPLQVFTQNNQNYLDNVNVTTNNNILFKATAGDIKFDKNLTGNGATQVTIDNSANFIIVNSGSTVSGVLDGVSLVKQGSGTLTLASNNLYTGGTTINGGTLHAQTNDSALGTGNVTINNSGTLWLDAIKPINALTLSGGTLSGTGTTATAKGAITVTADSTINTQNAADIFTIENTINANVLNGPSALNLQGPGKIVLGNAVGNAVALASIDATAASLTISGGTVKTQGLQSYHNAIVIGANTTFESTVNGLNFGNIITTDGTPRTLNFLYNLGLNFTGNLGTDTNPFTSISTSGVGNVTFNGTTAVITNDRQHYGNNVVLSNDDMLFQSKNNDINFDQNVSGNGFRLTIDNAGNGSEITGVLNGVELAKDGIGTLTLSNNNLYGGGTTINSGTVHAKTSNTALGTADVYLGSNGTLLIDGINAANALSLNGGSLVGTGIATASGTINLNSDSTISTLNALDQFTLTSDIDGAHTLALQGLGTLIFSGNLNLTGLNTSLQPFAIVFNGASNTFTNEVDFHNTGDVTFGDNSTDVFNFQGGLNRTVGKSILNSQINASTIDLGVISLAGDSKLSTTGNGNINLHNTIDGEYGLDIDTGSGLTTIANTVGATANLSHLHVFGALNLNGASISTIVNQTYEGAVLLGNNVNLSTSNSINFISTLDGSFDANITANIIRFNADVGAAAGKTLNKLNATAVTSITLGTASSPANIHTVQEQSYNGKLNLANNTNLTSDSAHLEFNGAITSPSTAYDLNLAYGTYATFTKDIGTLANPLKSLTVTGSGITKTINFTGTGPLQVFTQNNQHYVDDVNVTTNNSILFKATAGDILFDKKLTGNGATQVTIENTGSASTISDNLSGVSLVKQGTGTLTLTHANDYTGGTTINGGTLHAKTNDTALGAGDVTVNDSSTLWLDNIKPANALTLHGGTLRGTGTNATASGAITLTADNSVITTQNAADIFKIENTIDGGYSLNLQGLGKIILGNYVGNGTALASIDATAASLTISGGIVSTTGVQNYHNAIVIGNDTLFESTGNALNFANMTTDGTARALYFIDGTGLNFTGDIGTVTNPFNSIMTSGTGLITFTGTTNVITNEQQQYNKPVILSNNDMLFQSKNDDIIFGHVIGSGAKLTIDNFGSASEITGVLDGVSLVKEGSGTLTLASNNFYTGGTTINAGTLHAQTSNTALGSGAVHLENGGTLLLDNINAANTLNLKGGALIGTGIATASGTINLTNDSMVKTLNALDQFTLANNIDGHHALTLQGPGVMALGGLVGNNNALTTITSFSRLIINGNSVTTLGNQTYHQRVTAGNNTTMAMTGPGTSQITFDQGIDGGNNLELAGSSDTNIFVVNGPLSLNDVNVNASVDSHNNKLSLDTGGTQNWFINNNNAGYLLNVSNVSGDFDYTNIQNLKGGSGSDNFTLAFGGAIAGSMDGAGGNNALTGKNTDTNWNISGNNAGSVAGIGAGFISIQNLFGGNSDDTFKFAGGSLAGNIDGGDGSNTLIGDNSANTWHINGTDAGKLTKLGGEFSSIQNLTGGNANNAFIFANDGKITGMIDGGSLANTNSLDYRPVSDVVEVTLDDLYAGYTDKTTETINQFKNINYVYGDANYQNTITLPEKINNVFVTGPTTGYINDPLFYDGFYWFFGRSGDDVATFNVQAKTIQVGKDITAYLGNVVMQFINFRGIVDPIIPIPPTPNDNRINVDVASINNQPITNAEMCSEMNKDNPNAQTECLITNGNASVSQNLEDMANKVAAYYQKAANDLTISSKNGTLDIK